MKESKPREDKIVNLEQYYADKLVNLIAEKELEVENYKKKLEKTIEELEKLKKLNQLQKEIKLADENYFNELRNKQFDENTKKEKTEEKDVVEYKNTVQEELKEDVIEQENVNLKDDMGENEEEFKENMQLKDNNVRNNTKLEMNKEELQMINENEKYNLDYLKDAFINDREYEVRDVLYYIFENIKEIEGELNEEDIIFISYLCCFNNLLEELLKNSRVINKYYLLGSNEAHLLKLLLKERNCDLYKNIHRCAYEYMKSNENLFLMVNEELKNKLTEKLHDFAYKTFEVVYKINDIEYGVKTVNCKALIWQEKYCSWKLVEGLYSESENRVYLLLTVITILKLNCAEVIKPKEIKEEIIEEKNEDLKEIDDKKENEIDNNYNKKKKKKKLFSFLRR